MRPLVSVVTPTWQRHDLLLSRCIPSVQAQTYGNIEHVVVSDGPDGMLMGRFTEVHEPGRRLLLRCLPEHDPVARWGHHARLGGIAQADGEYIAYLDDDNSFRPDHVARLVAALEADPAAGFAYSLIQMSGPGFSYVVGSDPPQYGGVDTSAILHRRSLLEIATWRDDGWQETIDWDLVARWMGAGVTWAFDGEITADYYFT